MVLVNDQLDFPVGLNQTVYALSVCLCLFGCLCIWLIYKSAVLTTFSAIAHHCYAELVILAPVAFVCTFVDLLVLGLHVTTQHRRK